MMEVNTNHTHFFLLHNVLSLSSTMMMLKCATLWDQGQKPINYVSILFTLLLSCASFVLCAALFYYTLGNLSPKYRSSLHSIQMLIAVKSKFLAQYGADKILEPVLEEIKQLERVSVLIFSDSF